MFLNINKIVLYFDKKQTEIGENIKETWKLIYAWCDMFSFFNVLTF